MHRYRVNYRLLAGLAVGTLLVSVTAYFVWSWQINRKASWFRDRSEQALVQDDYLEAFNYMQKYVTLRRDEVDAQVQLASISSEILKMEDATREEKGYAFGILEETVRRTGDSKLKRELAEMIIGFRPQDALVHVEELLEETPNDPELLSMQAQAYFQAQDFRRSMELCYRLIGYNRSEDTFDADEALTPERPEIYALLASMLQQRDNKPELARRVIDQLVEVNPDLPRAHFNRAVFLQGLGEIEEATASLDQAYELDPEDGDILQQKGLFALRESEFDEAEKYFRTGLEKHPDRINFYRLLARTQMAQERTDEALEYLNQGIDKFGLARTFELVRDKLNILFQDQDYEGVNQEITALDRLQNPRLEPYINFQKARVKWQKQQWTSAVAELRRVWPMLIDFAEDQAMAGAMLASAYERQGKPDLAIQTYRVVLEKFPNYEGAKRGLASAQSRINPSRSTDPASELDKTIDQMAALPQDQQDWTAIEKQIAQLAEERDLSPARVKLLNANVMVKRKDFGAAKQLIREAAILDPEDLNVSFAAIALLAQDPDQGPNAALSLLDNLVKKHGDSLRARATRVQLMPAEEGADFAAELAKQVEGTDDWSAEERIQLITSIARRLEQARMLDEARSYWKQAIEIQPENLPIRMHLFDLAVMQQDDQAMEEAQQAVLDLVEDKNDGSYILTEVKRHVIAYSKQQISREQLRESRRLLDRALERRPRWHELHVLYGQLLLLLEEDIDLAVRHLEDALQYGPPNTNAVGLQVRLLGQRGDFAGAREKLDLLPEESRLQLVGRAEAEVLMRTGDQEAALESARRLAELEENNVATQSWFARLAREMNQPEEAVVALRRVAELQPSDADNWMQLVAIAAQEKDVEKILGLLREAQLAIEADHVPLLLAKQYELRTEWRAAEKLYLSSFAGRMEEPAIARRMAEFYLMWARADGSATLKAGPHINKILRRANEGELPADDPHVKWARNQAARIFASSGDYQDSLQAQQLLRLSAVDGQLSPEDQGLLTEILASRQEPQAQLEAIRTLTQMERSGSIGKNGRLLLAQLVSKTGDEDRSERILLDALARHPGDPEVTAAFINHLIDNAQFTRASSQIDRLRDLDVERRFVNQLSLKLASARGDTSRLRSILQSMLPRNLDGALDEQQLQNVLAVAQMATQVEEYELAENLYRVYVRRVPAEGLQLAGLLAMHGDTEEAIEIMKQFFNSNMDSVLQLASQMMRTRRPELGDALDAEVNRLVAAGLRDDPDSIQRMLIQAEVYEMQGDYERSVAMYDKVLKRDDVPRLMRAAAKNNLGYLLVLLNERLDEAAELIDEAMEIYGPVEDMLDTRGLVRIARQEYDAAVEDLKLATAMSKDPIKHYHLARAAAMAGNAQSAVKAWDRAQALGFAEEKLNKLELAGFEEFQQKIEGLRVQSAQL